MVHRAEPKSPSLETGVSCVTRWAGVTLRSRIDQSTVSCISHPEPTNRGVVGVPVDVAG
jgi:hypothetical protein